MNKPNRPPVQPWIPQQPVRVMVVREKERREPWRGALRSAWAINYAVLLAGVLLGGSVLLGAFKSGLGEAQGVASGALLVAGSVMGWLLWSFGFLGVVICAVVVMVQGALGRALAAVLGFFLCAGIALGMMAVAVAATDKREERAAEPASDPARPIMDAAGEVHTPGEGARLELPPPEAQELLLTNNSGVTIRARVMEMKDGILLLIKDGKEFRTGIETLDDASQQKVKKWAAGH